jgi:nucleotide-binding universal stress UspA family protein
MYRSLLVPLDGSPFAEQALPMARRIARRAGASVNVVLVHVPFTAAYADSIAPGTCEAEASSLKQERAYLDGIVKRITDLASTPVSSALLEGQVVAETLNAHASTTGTDLIVMTTHGRGPLSRFWPGSVADELVRRATTPILLIRPQEIAPDLGAEPMLRHILVPLDGSDLAEKVLEAAVGLGTLLESDYRLVRIYGPLIDTALDASLGGSQLPVEQLRAEAEGYLQRVAGRLQEQGHVIQTQAVLGQHPASAILDAAQGATVDLIALETHGRRGLRRLLMGSVADKVIRGASTPVLVHRSPRPENRT